MGKQVEGFGAREGFTSGGQGGSWSVRSGDIFDISGPCSVSSLCRVRFQEPQNCLRDLATWQPPQLKDKRRALSSYTASGYCAQDPRSLRYTSVEHEVRSPLEICKQKSRGIRYPSWGRPMDPAGWKEVGGAGNYYVMGVVLAAEVCQKVKELCRRLIVPGIAGLDWTLGVDGISTIFGILNQPRLTHYSVVDSDELFLPLGV